MGFDRLRSCESSRVDDSETDEYGRVGESGRQREDRNLPGPPPRVKNGFGRAEEHYRREFNPDPELEREAEETAERVMSGGELDIQRYPLCYTNVHVQRYPGQDRVENAREEVTERLSGDTDSEDSTEYTVPADADVLAEEVADLKERQAQIMEALTAAEPGAAGGTEWGETATKGVLGSLAATGAGAAVGAAAGSVIPGPGTAVGAATGAAVSGAVGDLTKKGVEFMDENRPQSEALEIEEMYDEMRQMYAELKESQTETGSGSSQRDELE